jgi:hypothetical protein
MSMPDWKPVLPLSEKSPRSSPARFAISGVNGKTSWRTKYGHYLKT